MQKIWITGAEGHVGSALRELLDCTEYQILTTDVEEVDITDLEQVKQYMHVNRPDVVINCAGLTNVGYCETHVDEAYKVNAIGVRNIVLTASEIHAKLIHMSTDDVFDMVTERPYNEFDQAHPKTIYGKSKEAGERFITQLMHRYVIIRSSWIYGIGKDFVDEVLRSVGTVAKLEVPSNRYGVPTSSDELAKIVRYFIDHDEYGLYHAVCKGSCSRYEFAKAILEYAGLAEELDLEPVAADGGLRPEYSVLDNMMLRLTGIPEPKDWQTALKDYIEEKGGIE